MIRKLICQPPATGNRLSEEPMFPPSTSELQPSVGACA